MFYSVCDFLSFNIGLAGYNLNLWWAAIPDCLRDYSGEKHREALLLPLGILDEGKTRPSYTLECEAVTWQMRFQARGSYTTQREPD